MDKKYFSGNIFAPLLGKDNKLKIVIFENEKEIIPDVILGNVFWSFDDKKQENPIDSESIEDQTLEDDHIF